MQIAWAAAARAHRELASEIRFRTGGEGSDFFVSQMHHLIFGWVRIESVMPLSELPGRPYIRSIPVWTNVSTITSPTFFMVMRFQTFCLAYFNDSERRTDELF